MEPVISTYKWLELCSCVVRCLHVMSKKLKTKICVELDSGHRVQRADGRDPCLSRSSAHQPHCKWTLLFGGAPEVYLQHSAFPFLLLSVVPSSSHPDSLTQMAAHAPPPFPLSVSNLEGEMRALMAISRRSNYTLSITLSLIKGHTTGTRRVWDQVMPSMGQTHTVDHSQLPEPKWDMEEDTGGDFWAWMLVLSSSSNYSVQDPRHKDSAIPFMVGPLSSVESL